MLINLTSHIMLSFGETQRTLKSWHDMLGPSGKREVKNGVRMQNNESNIRHVHYYHELAPFSSRCI